MESTPGLTNRDKRRHTIYLLAIILIAIASFGGYVAWHALQPDEPGKAPSNIRTSYRAATMQRSAEDLGRCIALQDTDCVAGYVTTEEMAATGVDESELRGVIGYSMAYLRGSVFQDAKTRDPDPGFNGESIYNANFQFSSGSMVVPLWIVAEDDGVKCKQLVSALLLMRWRSDPRSVSEKSRGGIRLSKALRGMREDREDLESLGADGIYYLRGRMSFDEFIAHCEKYIPEAEAAGKAKP